jgi:hypothetical protein
MYETQFKPEKKANDRKSPEVRYVCASDGVQNLYIRDLQEYRGCQSQIMMP